MDASDSWLEVFSLGQKQLDKIKIGELFPKNGELNHSLSGNKGFSLRHYSRKAMGIHWYRSTFAPWFDENENVIGSLIQTDDITSEVEKELELEKLNSNMDIISEVAHVGFWEYDGLTQEVHWCPQTKKIFQVPPSWEPDANSAIEFYKPGHSRNTISMLVHEAMSKGSSFNIRLPIITAKGEERWLSLAGKPITQHGAPVTRFGTLQAGPESVRAGNK